MTHTTKAPAQPMSYEAWFKNNNTGMVAVVTVEPGQTAAQALAERKTRSISKGHVWELISTSPGNNKLHTVQS